MRHSSAESKGDHTPFLMFYTSDWIAATHAFGFEERGFYSSVLFAMWERKGGLPDDPRWLGNCLNCDPRTARRLRDFLVKERKLESRDGFLVNRRMMLEISRYLRRKLPRPAHATTPDLDEVENNYGATSDGSSTEDRPEVGQDLFQFANEINGGSDHIPEAIFQKPEEEKDSPPALEQDPPCVRAGASPEAVILKSIADWTADESRARSWVTAHVGLYGLDVVRDAVAVVVAEIAAGRHVAQPVQLASSVIRRLDARKPGPEERAHREAGTIPPWVADKSIVGKRASDVLDEFYRQKAERMAAERAEVAA